VAELARAARPDAGVGANLPEYSVSELSSAIKRTLEGAYAYVRLRGEISGFRGAHSSGHCYFGLKDEKSKIEAVSFDADGEAAAVHHLRVKNDTRVVIGDRLRRRTRTHASPMPLATSGGSGGGRGFHRGEQSEG
jgi:hypothetical protein